MKKIICITVVYISSVVLPAYAFEETNHQNMSGAAVKILNKYDGSWKGWSDGCVNCGKPLASDKPKVTTAAKNKMEKISKAKLEAKPIPKSLRRGYCECSCDANKKSAVDSESIKGSDSGKSKNNVDSNQVDNKNSFNMDVRDNPKLDGSDIDNDDIGEKGKQKSKQLEKKDKESRDGSVGKDGKDGKDETEAKKDIEGATKEKSKFSIFSIWSS